MRKVQVVGYLLVVLLAGCADGTIDEEPEDPGVFGSPYEIVTNLSPAEPDEPPAIIGDSLTALVTYPGGCAEHRFNLVHEIRADTAWVWLRHLANGDACKALIHDRIKARVPDEVLASQSIMLLNPNEDMPFVLRWGRRQR